jgi:hypothetical protein
LLDPESCDKAHQLGDPVAIPKLQLRRVRTSIFDGGAISVASEAELSFGGTGSGVRPKIDLNTNSANCALAQPKSLRVKCFGLLAA